jgi:hypothetical protein
MNTAFLKQQLALPLWRGPGLSSGELQRLRLDWEPLPARLAGPGTKTTLYEYSQGEARIFARDFGFCRGKKFARVVIEDPFALSSVPGIASLKQFLSELRNLLFDWPDELTLHARESVEFSGQPLAKVSLEKYLQAAGVPNPSVKLIPRFGPNRRDFHDRRVVFIADVKKPQKRVTVLLTGGVDRYWEPRFECGVIVHES